MVEIAGIDVNRGDIVEVTWADHYAFKGKRPRLIVVKTWGQVDEITNDGIAVLLNEVQGTLAAGTKPDVERIMDGQFILRPAIREILMLKKAQCLLPNNDAETLACVTPIPPESV